MFWTSPNDSMPPLLVHLGEVALTLVGAWLALGLVRLLSGRFEARLKRNAVTSKNVTEAERNRRIETVLRVAYDVTKIVVYAFVLMTALAQFGVSIQPLVAGAGLLGAAVAFGSQTIVKDFVSGFFILLENHFDIGDSVTFSSGISGVVEKMSLRVTILRDADGSIHIVPNGSIGTVTNKTYQWSSATVAVSIDVAIDPDVARTTLRRAAEAVQDHDTATSQLLLGEVTVSGPNQLKEKSAEYTVSVKTQAGQGPTVRAWLIEAIVRSLQTEKVSFS